MESVSYAIASADKVKSFIHAEAHAADNKVTNEREARESKDARRKVGPHLKYHC